MFYTQEMDIIDEIYICWKNQKPLRIWYKDEK